MDNPAIQEKLGPVVDRANTSEEPWDSYQQSHPGHPKSGTVCPAAIKDDMKLGADWVAATGKKPHLRTGLFSIRRRIRGTDIRPFSAEEQSMLHIRTRHKGPVERPSGALRRPGLRTRALLRTSQSNP